MKTEEAWEARPRAAARASRRGRALAAVAAVGLAVAGLAAGGLAFYQWDGFVEYRSPYRLDLPPAPETPRLTERVVLVIVDGLREDVARELPTFRRLGEEGSFLVARAPEPSLSYPGWTTLVTGAPPEVSGVTTNWYQGRVEVDSLFDAADRAGITVALAGDEGWGQLFGGVEHTALVPDTAEATDPRVARRSLRMLDEVDPELLVVHLSDVDKRGHEDGVGERYLNASRVADGIVASIQEAVGRDAAMVVTSDHGHIDVGGHGGPEPETTRTPVALAGGGLAPGASGEVAQEDVAPLIAALLGMGRPAHAVGELRVALLDAPDDVREEIAGAHQEVASAFYAEATRVVGGRGDTAVALEQARAERLRHDILARLPIGLGAIALLAIALALSSHRIDGMGAALGVLVILAGLVALFLGRGLTFSFSHFNTEDQVQPFLLMRALDAALAGAAGGLVAGLVAGLRRRAGGLATGLGTVGWAMFVLGLGVTAYLVLFGWGFTWRLPNLSAAFAQLLGLVAVLALGVTAWLTGLVAAAAAWVGRGRRV